jgi:hypothetical protein
LVASVSDSSSCCSSTAAWGEKIWKSFATAAVDHAARIQPPMRFSFSGTRISWIEIR